LEGDQREIEWRIVEIRTAYEEGLLAAEDYFASLKSLRRDLRVNEKAIGEAHAAAERAALATDARSRWESWKHEERRAFVLSRLSAVLVQPKKGRHDSTVGEGEIVLVSRRSQRHVPAPAFDAARRLPSRR
jgi:hypothetical protein